MLARCDSCVYITPECLYDKQIDIGFGWRWALEPAVFVIRVCFLVGKCMVANCRITSAIEPTVEDMGFRLVRVQMTGTVRPVLQVMAEPSEGGAMTVEHCANLSRAISAVLDVADPVGGAYTLEVSSPGVDRPLVRLEDFEKFSGFDARIELSEPQQGQRRFKGKLGGLDADGHIVIGEGTEQFHLPFSYVRRAKLLLTDALLADHAKKSAAAAANSDKG